MKVGLIWVGVVSDKGGAVVVGPVVVAICVVVVVIGLIRSGCPCCWSGWVFGCCVGVDSWSACGGGGWGVGGGGKVTVWRYWKGLCGFSERKVGVGC